MTTAAIVIGALLLLAMVGISVYGAITLPSDARIPLHYGIGSYGNFASKTVLVVALEYGAISLARGRTTARSE